MTQENALAFIDRHVRLAHAGPNYVRHNDPEGLIVAVTDTLIIMQDASRPGGQPRAWDLELIAGAQFLDAPDDAGQTSHTQIRPKVKANVS